MAKSIRVVAVISDLHAGSVVAVMPPVFKTANDQEVRQNPLQAWYWECWKRTLGWIDETIGDDPAALILNGDMIEGDHHRTTEIISRDIGDHIEIARMVLQPLTLRFAKSFMLRGTECHTGNVEATLGKLLGSEINPETERRVFDRLTLDVHGTRLVARHHVTTTSRPWLESNGLGMELASVQLHAIRNGEPMPRVLCVAHRHVAGHVHTSEGICLATPAWQGMTRHTNKVVPAARCKTGAYILDWRDLPSGSLPRVHRKLFDAPHAKAITL